MTKITLIMLFKWNGDTVDPFRLGTAQDLSNFGYFERSTAKEMLTFASRTIVKRTQPGQRQSVQHNGAEASQRQGPGRRLTGRVRCTAEYICHVANRDGLAAIIFVDREYPVRSAFSVLQKARLPSCVIPLTRILLRALFPCS